MSIGGLLWHSCEYSSWNKWLRFVTNWAGLSTRSSKKCYSVTSVTCNPVTRWAVYWDCALLLLHLVPFKPQDMQQNFEPQFCREHSVCVDHIFTVASCILFCLIIVPFYFTKNTLVFIDNVISYMSCPYRLSWVVWGNALQVGKSQVRSPMGIIGISECLNRPGCTMALGSDHPLTDVSTRGIY